MMSKFRIGVLLSQSYGYFNIYIFSFLTSHTHTGNANETWISIPSHLLHDIEFIARQTTHRSRHDEAQFCRILSAEERARAWKTFGRTTEESDVTTRTWLSYMLCGFESLLYGVGWTATTETYIKGTPFLLSQLPSIPTTNRDRGIYPYLDYSTLPQTYHEKHIIIVTNQSVCLL